jgi:hypothetical protein
MLAAPQLLDSRVQKTLYKKLYSGIVPLSIYWTHVEVPRLRQRTVFWTELAKPNGKFRSRFDEDRDQQGYTPGYRELNPYPSLKGYVPLGRG